MCDNYARLYPNEVEFLIQINSFAPIYRELDEHIEDRAMSIDKFIDYEKKYNSNPPSYPEVALKKWMDAIPRESMDVPSTKALMIRGTKRKPDGTFYFM